MDSIREKSTSVWFFHTKIFHDPVLLQSFGNLKNMGIIVHVSASPPPPPNVLVCMEMNICNT